MTNSKTRICSICEKNIVDSKNAPFCSRRCADVDLSRWLKGSYVIPGPTLDVTDQSIPDLSQSKDHF